MNRLLIVLGLILLLSSCLPIPQQSYDLDLPKPVYLHSPLTVKTEYNIIDGFAEPNTESKYNKAIYTRYYFTDSNAATVLVLVPGIFAGSTDLAIIARQLVAAIPDLEVWVLDRRANLLENQSYFQKAIKSRNPEIAYDYYIKNYEQENGYQPIRAEDISFISHWTLDVHLKDLHEIIKLAENRFDKVILGGHSLGASIVAFYSAYNFANLGKDPGYRHIDGLFLIDGVLGRTGAFNRSPDSISLGPWELVPGEDSLDSETGLAYLPNLEYYYLKAQTLRLFAKYKPDDLAKPEFSSFPITNRAALGVSIDDDYSSSIVFSSSAGKAIGAEFSGNIAPFLLGDVEGAYSKSVVGVAADSEYVSWQNDEFVDVDYYAKIADSKFANQNEWYFPLRLLLDMSKYELSLEHTPNYVATKEVDVPTLAIGAARGLVRNIDGFSSYSNIRLGSQFSLFVVPSFTHLDIIRAKDNPVVSLFKIWLETNYSKVN